MRERGAGGEKVKGGDEGRCGKVKEVCSELRRKADGRVECGDGRIGMW